VKSAEELIHQVRRIYYKGKSLSYDWLSGAYKSQFRGAGLEFEEVRPWQMGDEVRSIDWNVTARHAKPFVKVFREERQLKVCFAADISSSMQFGQEKLKSYLAAEILAAIGLAALENRDRIEGYLFSDRIEKRYHAESTIQHLLHILRDLLAVEKREVGIKTNINCLLETIIKMKQHSLILFILSDFQAEIQESLLREVSDKNTVIAIELKDPLEEVLIDLKNVRIKDLESLKSSIYQSPHFLKEESLERFFRRSGAAYVKVYTNSSYEKKLHEFFEKN
jgi:uncharacterized protein (DUF58 family)